VQPIRTMLFRIFGLDSDTPEPSLEQAASRTGAGRAIACLDQAMQDVGPAAAGPLGQVLHDYFAWATTTTMSRYHESADDVPAGMPIPRWSWDGLHR